MLMYSKLKDETTKEYSVINQVEAKKLGWKRNDLEIAYDGNWYLVGYVPIKPEPTIEEQNEKIRQTREQLYIKTSDPLKQDYDEALARGEGVAEEKKQLWLASKDKIREENPYIEEGLNK